MRITFCFGEFRAVDPHLFFADSDSAIFVNAERIQLLFNADPDQALKKCVKDYVSFLEVKNKKECSKKPRRWSKFNFKKIVKLQLLPVPISLHFFSVFSSIFPSSRFGSAF